jgi:NADPH-dependent glutamate synthase beta subunit-like oxidoreductase
MDRLGHSFNLPPVKITQSQTIGIVGGGPTGLTAAQNLAENGYEVHVYEKSDSLGGMMTSIPPWRLPRTYLESDINRILNRCPGIHVHLNCGLGEQFSIEALKQKHDCVLLAIGISKDKPLCIPGEKTAPKGLYGINFLTEIGKDSRIKLQGNIVVIGGGNVAMDTARSALREGADSVQLFCLESREEMPAFSHEIEQAEKDGIIIFPSRGPVKINSQNQHVTSIEFVNCLSVFDKERRFNPEYGQENKTIQADTILVAIGLQVDSPELECSGFISKGLIKADFETMRTNDPKVFAAGDGAFGPSAVVDAMSHGHRASYYIKAFLEGRENPIPYQIPYRTRRISVAQDPNWEKLPREEQALFQFDKNSGSSEISECEATISWDMAKRQSARCLRCDAETGSSNYSRRTREHIQKMAKTDIKNTQNQKHILLNRLKPRDNPFPAERSAHIDDIVFLSAALTRLVIDPYREFCSTKTEIGNSLKLGKPFFITGFDDAPEDIRRPLNLGLIQSDCAYIGRRPLYNQPNSSPSKKLPWLQLIVQGVDNPDSNADGLVFVMGSTFSPFKIKRHHPNQLLGLVITASTLEEAIPFALKEKFDLLLLDGSPGIQHPWVELKGPPDLTIMRDTICSLRKLNQEEEIALIYFGGMKSGTDVAKTLAKNCNAAVFGVAIGIAIGGDIVDNTITFEGSYSLEERQNAVEKWIKATAQEIAIIARCTGKTNIHNLEPEDMRSITLTKSEAMGIPLVSGKKSRIGF